MDPYPQQFLNQLQLQIQQQNELTNQQIAFLASQLQHLRAGGVPGQNLGSPAQLKWPLQQLMGCIDWPKKVPHTFIQSVEIKVDETEFFGETESTAQGTFHLDSEDRTRGIEPSLQIGLGRAG